MAATSMRSERSDSTSFKAEDFREDRGRSLEEAMKNK